MRIIFEKETLEAVKKSAFFAERGKRILKSKSGNDEKFLYFKKKIIAHLNRLEEKEGTGINKAYIIDDILLKGGLPIGTIREWKGKKYIKVAPGKWKPKYDSETRGAKLSIAALKRKAEKCSSSQELLQLVLENRSRFSDKDGHPLPFVQELRSYVSGLNDKIEKQTGTKTEAKTKKENKQSGGDNGGELHDGKNKGYAARLREKFNQITDEYVGKSIKNEATGIEAVFSKESQKEIRSRTQNTKDNGFSLQEHFEVANQVIELFKGASLENTHDDIKNNEKDVKIERFLSKEVVLQSGKKVQACITVKHSLDKNGRTIYALETMDIKNALEKTRAKGQPVNTGLSNNLIIPQSGEKSSNKADKNAEANGSVNKKTGKFNTIEEVKNFYKRSEKWLKAPNGKNTNLSEKQWLQVRTTNFKNWFGDWENDPKNASKIVDENGEPLVVYHYTDNKFTEFNKNNVRGGKYGEGFYFAPKKLKEYGKYKMECFLNIRNIPEENPKSNWTFENWHIYGAESIVREFGNEDDMREFENISNKIIDTINNGKVDDTEPLYRERMKLTDKILKRNNYDGLIADKFIKEIIAIEPHQIKSATRNNGSFDINSANINKSIVWLQNYLPKNKRDAENSIEFLRRWRERKNRA